jgi:hypothetical protein
VRRTRLRCLGLLTSERVSISRSGLSAMYRSIVVPAGGWPRLSQLTGTAFQVCLTCMSSQGTRGVVKSARSMAVRKKSAESQRYHTSTSHAIPLPL